MRINPLGLRVLVGACLLTGPSAAQEAGPQTQATPSLQSRVERLERLLDNQALISLHQRISDLEDENRELQDRIERLTHRLDEVAKRQRNLYMDIDERVRALEKTAQDKQQAAPAAPPSSAPPAPPSAAASAEAAYQQAFARLQDKRYQAAIEAFRSFLEQYGKHDYAANAQYWLGEAHYVQENYEQAREAFAAVIKQYPDSGKVPDARLKLGFALAGLGEWQAARQTLQAVQTDYPDSTVSRLAGERLKRIRQE